MGEEHILRGELIYTFNYLGSTPLLDDVFRFSTRALAMAAHELDGDEGSQEKGCQGWAPSRFAAARECWWRCICLQLREGLMGLCLPLSEEESDAEPVSGEFTACSNARQPEHKGGQGGCVGRRQLDGMGWERWVMPEPCRLQNSTRSQRTQWRWHFCCHPYYFKTKSLILFKHC